MYWSVVPTVMIKFLYTYTYSCWSYRYPIIFILDE